jgi:hypothetical protein
MAPGALDPPFFYGAESPESIAFVKQMTSGFDSVQDVVPLVEFLASSGRAVADGSNLVRERRPAHALTLRWSTFAATRA